MAPRKRRSARIKLAIIGAGSAIFSSRLLIDLCLAAGLKGTDLALVDIDQHRLAVIERFARRLSDELGAGLRVTAGTVREPALDGASFVVNTAQVGGHEWAEGIERELSTITTRQSASNHLLQALAIKQAEHTDTLDQVIVLLEPRSGDHG